jgi:hypothetical protein
MTGEEQHDVVVVGGGVAGVNCALECFDIQLDTVLVEASAALGGQLPDILHSVRNVAAGRFADGRALQQALLESAEILGDRVLLSHHVTKADLEGRAIEVDGDVSIVVRRLPLLRPVVVNCSTGMPYPRFPSRPLLTWNTAWWQPVTTRIIMSLAFAIRRTLSVGRISGLPAAEPHGGASWRPT